MSIDENGSIAVPVKARMSFDEFEVFTALPENAGRLFELINGEIIEVMPGRTSNSEIGHIITVGVHIFCRGQNLPCHTSGGDGAYRIQGDVVAPDFAFKPTPMSKEYPDPVPPFWAVEIVSPTDKVLDVANKRVVYIRAGILYWEIYPEALIVQVYAPGKPMVTLGIDDPLDGGDVLPGFKLAVRELFES